MFSSMYVPPELSESAEFLADPLLQKYKVVVARDDTTQVVCCLEYLVWWFLRLPLGTWMIPCSS